MENNQYKYTRNEQIDMLLIYGECRKNAINACALYAARFPERHHPDRTYFRRVEMKLRKEPNNVENEFIVSEEAETNVLAYVQFSPSASIRELEIECNVSKESARKILKKHKYRSYKYNLHQHLYENDSDRRLVYCNWLLRKQVDDNNFLSKILFSDETRFTNNGMFNRNNMRYWAQENPRLLRQGRFQDRFGFNVWAGIIGNRIIGPIFFYGSLTGERYLEFLQNEIQNEINNLPQDLKNNMYFHQDGAGPHNARIVRDYLNETYEERWIGTNGPVRWPPRSPDLNPLDFYLWGYIKDKVYSRPPTTLADLRNRVTQAFQAIANDELRNVVRCTLNRTQLCVAENGYHFEHIIGH